jgi:outer membrane protein assembly factor BamB
MARPATPVVHDGRVIVPFFDDRELRLTCFKLDSGEVVWKQTYDDAILGDPILIGASLYVLTAQRQLGDYADVVLRRVSPQTGESLLANRLLRVRWSESMFRVGRPALVGDTLIFRTGNALVACSMLGDVRWIRRMAFVPPGVDSPMFDFMALDDIVVDSDRVIVTCPGSPYVSCVAFDTGELIWSHLQPRVRRVVGRFGDVLVISTVRHVEGLDIKTGKPLWQTPVGGDYDAVLPADGGPERGDAVVTLTLDRVQDNDYDQSGAVRRMRWLSAKDGSVIREVPVYEEAADVFNAEKMLTDGRLIFAMTNVPVSGEGAAKLALLEPTEAAPADPTPIAEAQLNWGPWHAAGPFKADGYDQAYKQQFEPEKQQRVTLDEKYDGDVKWEPRPQWADGQPHELGTASNVAHFLYRTVHAARDGSLPLSLGSDDSIKLWVNGREVLAHHINRGVAPNQERVTVQLQRGENTILMKIVNGSGPSGFYFQPR